MVYYSPLPDAASGSLVGAVASFDLQDEPLASMIAPKLPVE
jgi:hypothetical protein